MALLNLPAGVMDAGAMAAPQAPDQSFTWGQAGRRLTPEDIALQRKIAASLMQPDYSPISSPWQGLARVAGNLSGALDERRADRASEANMADQQRIAAALMGGAAGTAHPGTAADPGMSSGAAQSASGINPAIAEALASPYVDDATRKLAMAQWERANPKPVNNDTIADYNFRTQTLGKDAADEWLRRGNDPFVNMSLPGGVFYAGPQSGIGAALGQPSQPQAAPASPEQGAALLARGAQTGVLSPEEWQTITSAFGPNGQQAADAWRQKNGVAIGKQLSNGQTAYLVSGKWYDNPEGR